MIDHGQWISVPGQPPWQINRHKIPQSPLVKDDIINDNTNNPYHVLSEKDHLELQKLTLPDGSIVYCEFPSIENLFERLQRFINGNCGKNFNSKTKFTQNKIEITTPENIPPPKLSLIERVRDHAYTKKK